MLNSSTTSYSSGPAEVFRFRFYGLGFGVAARFFGVVNMGL